MKTEYREVRSLAAANELGAEGWQMHSRHEHHDGTLYMMERSELNEDKPAPELQKERDDLKQKAVELSDKLTQAQFRIAELEAGVMPARSKKKDAAPADG